MKPSRNHMTKFDCFKCHAKCKAACCSVAPIEKEIYERNLDKRLRHVLEEKNPNPFPENTAAKKMVLPITEDMKCTFLKPDLTCNIEHDKPLLCKKFGDESHLMMTCVYQDKNGRIRSRQERRALERKTNEKQSYSLDYLIKIFGDWI
jgi:Fe-S-cluster containining protein